MSALRLVLFHSCYYCRDLYVRIGMEVAVYKRYCQKVFEWCGNIGVIFAQIKDRVGIESVFDRKLVGKLKWVIMRIQNFYL